MDCRICILKNKNELIYSQQSTLIPFVLQYVITETDNYFLKYFKQHIYEIGTDLT